MNNNQQPDDRAVMRSYIDLSTHGHIDMAAKMLVDYMIAKRPVAQNPQTHEDMGKPL